MTFQAPELNAIPTQQGDLDDELSLALQAVEQRMFDVVDSQVDVLRDASRHIISAGGKRIRPRLALLSYAALGGTQFDDVIAVAAALELLHTASVVHDDINDHGVLRRGRPSVNALWGRTFALLTGDYIFTKVYELVAPLGSEMNIVLAQATTALVEGETLQAAAVKNRQFTREVYYRIIGLKTAELFRAATLLGARAAGATDSETDALAEYGFNIGLAFQIIDDVLDVVGSPEQLGKTSGIDIEQGRGFASAYETKPATNGHTIEAADPMVSIREHVLNGDALREAYHQAHHFVQTALDQIRFLPDSPAKDELFALANSVIERSA
jgi:geranylgeranyl pyrophosphate synthase